MPYCETCEHYYAPTGLTPEGKCPNCGRQVADPAEQTEQESKTPWHFKLLVGLLVVYLTWRFLQLFGVL